MKNILYITASLLVISCNKNQYDMSVFHKMYGGEQNDVGTLIEDVSKHKVYFGRQSVGLNIVSGLEQWKEETGVQLTIAESKDLSNATASFVHFGVGRNEDPYLKIDDFVSMVEAIPEEDGAVAFFKLCYVDITHETDVDALYNYYKEKMYQVKEEHPNYKIILMTCPVQGIQKGLRATVKRVLGMQPVGVWDNIKRHEFNTRLLNECSDDFPIFDLAGIETTLPDGSTQTYRYKGEEYPCMPDLYRSDYGHLNDFGSKIAGYNLLAFLSEELR